MKRTKRNNKLTMNLPLKSLNKQKVTDVIKENQKLQKQLKEIEPVKIPKPKVSADQIRKVREAIELQNLLQKYIYFLINLLWV